jgi:predicted SnoaL-like aldol condensation-catalyzing enzyme
MTSSPLSHTRYSIVTTIAAVAGAAALAFIGGSTARALPGTSPQSNKDTVIAFYNLALNEKNPEGALRYLGPKYIQHNPNAEDGQAGFVKYISFIRDKFPRSHSEIKAVFAEGDYVILHVRTRREPDQRGNAIAEFFRLESGKIVEHWDVIQPIPETDLNGHGMF